MSRARCARCAGCASACRGLAWRGAIRVRCAPRWCSPWSPPSPSPATMRPRGWRRRWSRHCRATSRRRPPSCRPGSRRPAYTRLAPIFLKPDSGTVSVPAGARLTVSVTGGSGAPTLALDGHCGAVPRAGHGELPGGSRPDRGRPSDGAARRPPAGGVGPDRRRRPAARRRNGATIPAARPAASRRGCRGAPPTTMAWCRCRPRCGCAIGRDAPPLVVSLPLPGGTPKTAHGVSQQDLTAHPWAGLPVIAQAGRRATR